MAMKWLNEATLIIECGNYQLLHIDNVGSSLRRLRILLLQNYSISGRYASKSPHRLLGEGLGRVVQYSVSWILILLM